MKIINTLTVVAAITLATISLTADAATVGEKSPDFILKTLDGRTISSNDLKGDKPIYLKFWATWCSYCTEEMPHLQQAYDEFGSDIEVIAVNVGMNDSVRRINKYMNANQFTLPVNFDAAGDMVQKFAVVGTPQHIIIDKNGEIMHRSALITDDLHGKLENVVSENN